MIQRIQTVWLLLAALLAAGLFILPVYQAEIPQGFSTLVEKLYITQHFPTLITVVVLVVLPLVAIFLFKDRKTQFRLTLISLFVALACIGVNMMRISNYLHTRTPEPRNSSYTIGSVLPVASLVFLALALNGIRKDEKLVRSADRLR